MILQHSQLHALHVQTNRLRGRRWWKAVASPVWNMVRLAILRFHCFNNDDASCCSSTQPEPRYPYISFILCTDFSTIPMLYSIHRNFHKTATDHSALQPNLMAASQLRNNNCLKIHSNCTIVLHWQEQIRWSLFAWVRSQLTTHRKQNRHAARKTLWLNNAGDTNSNIHQQLIRKSRKTHHNLYTCWWRVISFLTKMIKLSSRLLLTWLS